MKTWEGGRDRGHRFWPERSLKSQELHFSLCDGFNFSPLWYYLKNLKQGDEKKSRNSFNKCQSEAPINPELNRIAKYSRKFPALLFEKVKKTDVKKCFGDTLINFSLFLLPPLLNIKQIKSTTGSQTEGGNKWFDRHVRIHSNMFSSNEAGEPFKKPVLILRVIPEEGRCLIRASAIFSPPTFAHWHWHVFTSVILKTLFFFPRRPALNVV